MFVAPAIEDKPRGRCPWEPRAPMALQVAPYRIRVNAIAPRAHRYGRPRYGSSEAELAGMAR
jgi:hypothetical protein